MAHCKTLKRLAFCKGSFREICIDVLSAGLAFSWRGLALRLQNVHLSCLIVLSFNLQELQEQLTFKAIEPPLVLMVPLLIDVMLGRMTGLIGGTAVPFTTGHGGLAVALTAAGGSKADWHHLPPQIPAYWVRFKGPAKSNTTALPNQPQIHPLHSRVSKYLKRGMQ